MLYLAIDQHRKQLTVNQRREDGEVFDRRQVSTRWQDVRAFLERVRSESEADGGFVVILEVCGFNDWLLQLLKVHGRLRGPAIGPCGTSAHCRCRREARFPCLSPA